MSGRALHTSRYSPGNLAPHVLERLFVGRSELLDDLIAKVSRSILSKDKQHLLLVGPRGTGKTHFIALLHQRLTTDPGLAAARAKSVIAYLNEEEWGVASFLDFILAILRSIRSDHEEIAGRITLVEETFGRDPDKARDLAEDTLVQVVKDKTLVLLCENLHDLFEGIGAEGQARWRSLVQEHPFWCIVATVPSLFFAISRQTEPFYGFFTIRSLEKLSVEDAIELLRRKAELEGRHDLAEALDTPIGRARVRAIHHIAGGNHRAYIVLSEFLTKESLDELVSPFMNMVDDLTPYYQERMRNLTSPLQRKLVDYLCRQRAPTTVKDIAKATLVQPQSAAKQLGELTKAGIVQKASRGRESFYELSEPLMRICIEVKDNRTGYVRIFVDLLRHWFSSSELESRHRNTELQPGSLDHLHLWAALEDYRASRTDPFLDALKFEAFRCEQEGNLKGVVEAAGRRADELGQLPDYEHAIKASIEIKDYASAERRALDAIARYPNNIKFRSLLVYTLYIQDNYIPAIAQCDEILKIDSQQRTIRRLRGEALLRLARYKDTIVNEDELLRIDPENSRSHEIRAFALWSLGRREEATASLMELTAKWPSFAAYFSLAGMAFEVDRHEESLRYCNLALEYGPKNSQAWCLRSSIFERLGRLEEALENERHLLMIDPNHFHAYSTIADVLMKLGRLDEAFEASNVSIARAPDEILNWRLHLEIAFKKDRFREADEAIQRIKRLSNKYDHVLTLFEVGLKGILGLWRDAVTVSEEAIRQNRTPEAIFANAFAVIGSGANLSQQQEAWVMEHCGTVASAWLLALLHVLHVKDLDELREAIVTRAGSRMNESGDLLYEQALVYVDQGKFENAAAAAERLTMLGAVAKSRSLMLLVKVARHGMSNLLGEMPPSDDSDEHAILEMLDISLWVELQQHGPSSFASQVTTLREELSSKGQEEFLSDALMSVLRRLVRTRSALSRNPAWPDALKMMASGLPGFGVPLQLFSVGVRYAATHDEGILLELPLEQRKLLIDEAGMTS